MKFFFILLISLPCFAARPPSQDVIDQYVNFAMRIDKEKIQNLKGKWTCSDALEHNNQARGRTQQEAITGHQLLCIKNQCEILGKKVIESARKLKDLPEEDLRDFLEFNGYSKEEIDLKVTQIKNSSPDSEVPQNCNSGTANFRMIAFDSCFAVPVECSEN